MELKYSPKKAAEGKVQTLPHFSVDQRIFLTEWPWTYLFWRVENEWFLFDEGFEILGHVPFSEFEGMCKWHWRGTPGWKTLYSILNCRS